MTEQKIEYTFTFFVEWEGGTYISQTKASDYKDSVKKWKNEFDISLINLTDNDRSAFIQGIHEDEINSIDTVESVWCFSPYVDDDTMPLIHIIRTI